MKSTIERHRKTPCRIAMIRRILEAETRQQIREIRAEIDATQRRIQVAENKLELLHLPR